MPFRIIVNLEGEAPQEFMTDRVPPVMVGYGTVSIVNLDGSTTTFPTLKITHIDVVDIPGERND
jgi:hypothetical protein